MCALACLQARRRRRGGSLATVCTQQQTPTPGPGPRRVGNRVWSPVASKHKQQTRAFCNCTLNKTKWQHLPFTLREAVRGRRNWGERASKQRTRFTSMPLDPNQKKGLCTEACLRAYFSLEEARPCSSKNPASVALSSRTELPPLSPVHNRSARRREQPHPSAQHTRTRTNARGAAGVPIPDSAALC